MTASTSYSHGAGGWATGRPRRATRNLIEAATVGEILSTPAAREIMAWRAIDEVYRLLGRHGISQRRIAALTGQPLILSQRGDAVP